MDFEAALPHVTSETRGSLRIGLIRISPFWVAVAILVRLTHLVSSNANDILVRCSSLIAQMVSSVVLMSESSDNYIPLGVLSFLLGIIEAGVEFGRL